MDNNPELRYGYWIKKIVRDMTNIHDEKLMKHNLTSSQVSVLCQLWHKDGLTQKEIQESLNLKAASVSGLVDTLSSKGFIVRIQDPEDARAKRLYLTEEGKDLRHLSFEIIKDIESILTQGFSEDEKLIFISWMKKIYNNIHPLVK